MNKAYKFRIYPNAEQAVMFAKTFGCVRFIYNKMLGDKIAHYNETKLCHVCAHKNAGLTLTVREWICPDCNTNHDRDVNAAVNIRNEAVRLATA